MFAGASAGASEIDSELASTLQSIAENERAEREAAVLELNGGPQGCAIVQWPGRWSGNRQHVIIVHNTTRLQSDTVSCVLVGKVQDGSQRPCACYEHPSSQAKGACIEKKR